MYIGKSSLYKDYTVICILLDIIKAVFSKFARKYQDNYNISKSIYLLIAPENSGLLAADVIAHCNTS